MKNSAISSSEVVYLGLTHTRQKYAQYFFTRTIKCSPGEVYHFTIFFAFLSYFYTFVCALKPLNHKNINFKTLLKNSVK